MTLSFEYSEKELTVTLVGEIDQHHSKAARESITAKLDEHTPSTLFMNMSGVSFCDSSGLGLIMGRHRDMEKRGGELVISSPSNAVWKILDISGLDKVIKIER